MINAGADSAPATRTAYQPFILLFFCFPYPLLILQSVQTLTGLELSKIIHYLTVNIPGIHRGCYTAVKPVNFIKIYC